jgi:hypothetical protein
MLAVADQSGHNEQQVESAPSSPPRRRFECHPAESLIIFDWDDTLLASSFLSSKGYRLDVPLIASSEIEADLKKLESTVIQLLNLAMTYGKTCIITNAETGWVQLSAQKFLPGVVPLLSKIRVLSARSTFEARFPDSPHKWKYHAFTENIHELLPLHMKRRGDRNIMSFGDSHVEREAVQAVTKDHPETLTKSIKFVERPSMEQLWRQLELVTNCFKDICNHDGDLDLMLTISLFS